MRLTFARWDPSSPEGPTFVPLTDHRHAGRQRVAVVATEGTRLAILRVRRAVLERSVGGRLQSVARRRCGKQLPDDQPFDTFMKRVT